MDLREACFHLRNRRRMYLLDDRFVTAVSFIDGFNAALEGQPLDGFREWLNARILGHRSSLHWAYVIASTRVPEVLEGGIRLDEIPHDCDTPLIEEMLQLLVEFSHQDER